MEKFSKICYEHPSQVFFDKCKVHIIKKVFWFFYDQKNICVSFKQVVLIKRMIPTETTFLKVFSVKSSDEILNNFSCKICNSVEWDLKEQNKDKKHFRKKFKRNGRDLFVVVVTFMLKIMMSIMNNLENMALMGGSQA